MFISIVISLYILFLLSLSFFKTSHFLWILMTKVFQTFKCKICFLVSRPCKYNIKLVLIKSVAKWMVIDTLTFMQPSTSVFKNSRYFIVWCLICTYCSSTTFYYQSYNRYLKKSVKECCRKKCSNVVIMG